ncbi:MAG: hypothetical protein KAI72_10155, partial [Candidatus Pacebacteria bacterium]|nr:hypothetical protein [Candidatus Paceibacterota bacterium]
HLPPYIEVIFAKRQGVGNPVFTQNYYRWYVNANSQTPTDPWPSGATNLSENEKITATSTPIKPGDILRLRMSVGVTNATTTATSTSFRLQYGEGSDCSAVSSWSDVGQIASSTIWRGYNNTSVADGSTLSSTTLSVTDVAESYEEENNSTTTPNSIGVGEDGEWDWVIYDNGATSSTNYCFRMVESDGTVFNSYTRYPQVMTNNEPNSPTPVKLFDNEKVASTTPWFEFYTTDDESDKVHYQIQVDDDNGFGSTIIDKDTISNSSQFENTIVPADKAPYIQNNTIRFISGTTLANNTTYWWRIRAKDPNGSNTWGAWGAKKSFTIDTSVTLSTWF